MMHENNLEILRTSVEQRELKKISNKLAASDREDEIAALLHFMNDQDYLSRLDRPEDYESTYSNLRLASVVNVLMRNPSEYASQAIADLTSAEIFLGNLLRIQILIFALSATRPLAPRSVDFLDRVSTAESPLVYDTVKTLSINQSEPALQLLEEKFIRLQLPDNQQKITWMRDLFLPRRNDEPLLGCCERLLNHPMPEDFKIELVDVLFDYKPDDWYVGCRRPSPPPREEASPEALERLERIGQFALNTLRLASGQKKQVQGTLERISS